MEVGSGWRGGGSHYFFFCVSILECFVWLLMERMKREVLLKGDILHTHTHTNNIVGAKRLGVLRKHILPPRKDSLVAVISLRKRTRNMRPLEKYEGVKTVLVPLYVFLRKH